jgi:hypothetical protein
MKHGHDPETNLSSQREIVARILDNDQDSEYWNTGDSTGDAIRLAELVQALDKWLQHGGALPITWGVR